MEDIRAYLTETAQPYGIEISPEQAEQFQLYAALLAEWNEKINLTAITEPKEIAVKHFLDSLLLLPEISAQKGASFIDVGTGAGFPGVALLILRPDLRLTLLDSLQKRLLFLEDLLKKLGLDAELLHARAEEAARKKEYRQKFDFAAARAVASLPTLCEYCLPFLKQGGVFAAMKGPAGPEELKNAEHAVQVLGCSVRGEKRYTLPGGDERTLILISRTGPLLPSYPRQSAKITKAPL